MNGFVKVGMGNAYEEKSKVMVEWPGKGLPPQRQAECREDAARGGKGGPLMSCTKPQAKAKRCLVLSVGSLNHPLLNPPLPWIIWWWWT